MHGFTNIFLSSAADWIVIVKQHCVFALAEVQNEQPQWMQIVNVNLLKKEMSWSPRVAIAGWKQAIDLDISAVPPSEAADNFLMHLRDTPAGPEESARDHIHRTIWKAASGSAWIPLQVSSDELKVCFFSEFEAS